MVIIFGTSSILAQDTNGLAKGDQENSIDNVNFSAMPFLSYNRNLGFMMGAIPMVMYRFNRTDELSPKSISGLTGIYTTNGSYVFGVFNKFYFKQDNWRGTLFFMNGDLSSQFFFQDIYVNDFYDFATNATIASAGLQRKMIKGLYGGFSYTYSKLTTSYQDDIFEETTTTLNGLEFNLLYDNRDDVYYPFSGNKIDAVLMNYSKWMGNQDTANKIKANYNTYFPIRNKTDVLAARLSSTFGLGTLSFEQQTIVGGGDIRGYSEGKYRGDVVVALQGEYRWNLAPRIGVVGFVGMATLFGSLNPDFDGAFLPGGGAGFRYRAFKNIKFNVGLDAALGKDDWGIYFRIGEAF